MNHKLGLTKRNCCHYHKEISPSQVIRRRFKKSAVDVKVDESFLKIFDSFFIVMKFFLVPSFTLYEDIIYENTEGKTLSICKLKINIKLKVFFSHIFTFQIESFFSHRDANDFINKGDKL